MNTKNPRFTALGYASWKLMLIICLLPQMGCDSFPAAPPPRLAADSGTVATTGREGYKWELDDPNGISNQTLVAGPLIEE